MKLTHHSEMTADELLSCSYGATAIIKLCELAVWKIADTGKNFNSQTYELADAVTQSLALAGELLAPVHDALERHEIRGARE